MVLFKGETAVMNMDDQDVKMNEKYAGDAVVSNMFSEE